MASKETRNKNWARNTTKNGATGLAYLADSIEHACEHRDWTVLGPFLGMTEGSDKARLRKIVGACIGGIKLTSNSKAVYGFTIKGFEKGGNAAPTEKLAILHQLVTDGVSFRSKEINDALFEQSETTFDLFKYMARVVKKLEKEEVTLDQAINAYNAAEAAAGNA